MALSSQLVVPMTIWGQKAPCHSVSCVVLTKDSETVVTGSHEGQLCIWDEYNGQLIPRSMLYGHTSKVVCLATERNNLTNQQLLVSASESGEMSLWDMNDCRCVEATKLQYIHTDMRCYTLTGADIPRLFCCGYYAEIVVMDMISLNVLFTLSSRVDSDWIAAMDIIHPSKRNDDILVALSSTGYMKVWKVDEQEAMRNQKVIYEGESKPIDCYHAVGLSCCMYNQRTILIVCPLAWHVYDASDFSHLCSQEAYNGEKWSGGRFLCADSVLSWTNTGKGYIYKIPGKAIPGSAQFHTHSKEKPVCVAVLQANAEPNLVFPPASSFFLLTRDTLQKVFIQGDANGGVYRWKLQDFQPNAELNQPVLLPPSYSTSLQASWDTLNPPPVGLLDGIDVPGANITSSVFLPIQGRLACGRTDGSIVIISVIHAVMSQVLWGAKHIAHRQQLSLVGHSGKVTALLYPHNVNNRYDVAYLVSGGVDFSVCVWDLYSGTLLHRFSVHSGEILQLQVPPDTCNLKVLQCVCAIGADHAVSLLNLKDRKCVLLASRHLFPVISIKWRPFDDFMIVACSDGSVYVWQMETCHLDRVIQGMMAEDILNACDENVNSPSEKISNPALHLLRGLRHRNIAAIKHAAQRGLVQLHNHLDSQNQRLNDPTLRNRAHPLVIQGLKTKSQQQDSHVFFFDIEALIVQLLTEEYAQMTPGTLESHGLINQTEYDKYFMLASSPDANKKLAGFIAKVKDTAESAASKIQATAQATAESVGIKSTQIAETKEEDSKGGASKPGGFMFAETNQTMQTAQLLLSQLHAWGLDQALDQVCQSKLGLLSPVRPAHFGLLSRSGHMALFLPTHMYKLYPSHELQPSQPTEAATKKVTLERVSKEVLDEEERARRFASQGHWQLAKALTTNHLLSLISLANTLMSMNSATFIDEQERRRKLSRKLSRTDSRVGGEPTKEMQDVANQQQILIKEGWSKLATHHCVCLPELVKSDKYKRPQLEMLARRWQDRCLEVREAAQALLLAELRSIGVEGRRKVIDSWSLFLPNYGEHQLPPLPGQPGHPGGQNQGGQSGQSNHPTTQAQTEDAAGEESDDDEFAEDKMKLLSAVTEAKRKQSTAVVLLAVIGATYQGELERKTIAAKDASLTRTTSQALSYLLLSPPTSSLPAHTSLRRAAIDLIGRGFVVWESHLDVTRVLIGLLELCCNSDKLVPTMTYGLPLTPISDSCRSARHSLSLIATARPPAFITTIAKEVHRYNAMAQNAQTLPMALSQTVLHRAKPEILRIVELLIERNQNEVHDLLVEVMDIVLHCLDSMQLKTKGLEELFPAICRFHNVSHCRASRRIAVGARNGNIALYELKAGKCQTILAHASPVTAVAFSPEGKYLASYSAGDNKLSFWQTATGLFGLGNAQTKCLRTCNTPQLSESVRSNPLRIGRLLWPTNKVVILMLADGTEHRFSL